MLECLKKLGYELLPGALDPRLGEWFSWYRGKVAAFHNYSQYNGKKKVRRERATLGMAKKVCEDWANLLLNEKVEISTSDPKKTAIVRDVLERNNFRVKANQLLEMTFALGTGAFLEYLDRGEVKVEYIHGDKIYPISWDNGVIKECAFGSETVVGGKVCFYLQLHVLEHGMYVIKNRLFEKSTHMPVALPDGVMREYYTGSGTPLFQIVTPNIANSSYPDSPVGVSVYAGSLDLLKGIDLVYDSYQNEFRLGKKRIVVPVGMAQLAYEETGMVPVFDDNDTEFYAFSDHSLTDLKEINMEIRANEHSEGLRQIMSLLSDMCGLGPERYRYENGARGSVKTATEVISEESALYQNLRKHELVLSRALRELVRGILFLKGESQENLTVDVAFDDSIIHDTGVEFEQHLQLVDRGIMTVEEFRNWWFHEGAETLPKRTKEASPSQSDEATNSEGR